MEKIKENMMNSDGYFILSTPPSYIATQQGIKIL